MSFQVLSELLQGFLSLLALSFDRRTIRTEAVKGRNRAIRTRASIRFSSVSTNIRMTVITRKSGGLWVHAPIAPTKECIQYCEGIQGQCHMPLIASSSLELGAPVENIFLPTFAYEHKIFVGLFSRISSCPYMGGIKAVELAPEFATRNPCLASAKNGLAAKLLSKGKEIPQEPAVDNQMNRQKGWERMVLQILFLGPSNLLEPNTSFAQMSQKLIVSPIVKTLVFSKVPEKAGPEFLAAFAFLDDLLLERYVTRASLSRLFTPIMGKAASYFPPDDMKTLSSLDQFLVSVGAVKKTVPCRKKQHDR
ncbi:hypothetical protein NC653_012434 [Populus alba x Populus x berolinensis]|uniref:Uncharacterized protein n=1 Tax=Populus alba x Populus x berolinensis TaxID=444605 RepID=A0AAD6W7N5_9ROSI|nr:hypothetical protein NC653_012434 [Populus alba x Populus x berolinensis]